MSSKRTFRRQVKKERERLAEILRNARSAQETKNDPSCSLQTPQVEISQKPNNFIEDSPQSLRQKLRKWYNDYKPSVECCNSLLKILKSEGMDVPLNVDDLVGHSEICEGRTVTPGLATTTRSNVD